ncbi:MAG: gamma-glutamylcyclotransferase [Granulosicoccus sp.]
MRDSLDNAGSVQYVFGYGSLIWRPGFEFDEVCKVSVAGYERRFWQASHDHRGTPEQPGRVVTLVPVQNGECWGLAYRLSDNRREQILAALDLREKDGYQRQFLSVRTESGKPLRALTWVAREDNPSWRGGEPFNRIVNVISTRKGPSGSNAEYLLKLNECLLGHNITDSHVQELARSVMLRLSDG